MMEYKIVSRKPSSGFAGDIVAKVRNGGSWVVVYVSPLNRPEMREHFAAVLESKGYRKAA